jgi:hypothetical protein
MRSWVAVLVFGVSALALGGLVGCDAIDRRVARSGAGAGGDGERAKPMKLTTEPEGVTVSMGGDALGQTPIILDANRIEWPLTVRVHFEEEHREFTLSEYEPVRTLAADEGQVPGDVAVQEKAREEREKKREKKRTKLKVNKVKGAEHISPY